MNFDKHLLSTVLNAVLITICSLGRCACQLNGHMHMHTVNYSLMWGDGGSGTVTPSMGTIDEANISDQMEAYVALPWHVLCHVNGKPICGMVVLCCQPSNTVWESSDRVNHFTITSVLQRHSKTARHVSVAVTNQCAKQACVHAWSMTLIAEANPLQLVNDW